ncbi:hypothetical protein Esti_006460 [Eimeria stiedai]
MHPFFFPAVIPAAFEPFSHIFVCRPPPFSSSCFSLNRVAKMPGSCRACHGVDPGVHPQRPVAARRLGEAPAGFPQEAGFEACSYCTQLHQDPRKQTLYPLKPEQHLAVKAQEKLSTRGLTGRAAGKPTELFAKGDDCSTESTN